MTKKSNHALSSSLYREVVFFIKKIGKEAGEESEGRHLKRENRAVKRGVVYFLPAFYSVALLYRLFIAHYQEKYKLAKNKPPPLSLRQFYYIFQAPECECVQLRSPRSDVCDVCLLYRSRIRRDTGIVDENDEEEVSAWNEHVTRAKEARNVYRDEIKAAQQGFKDFLAGHKKAEEYIPHATFDFAQNLGLPQLSDEPQEIYFASQRSIDPIVFFKSFWTPAFAGVTEKSPYAHFLDMSVSFFRTPEVLDSILILKVSHLITTLFPYSIYFHSVNMAWMVGKLRPSREKMDQSKSRVYSRHILPISHN